MTDAAPDLAAVGALAGLVAEIDALPPPPTVTAAPGAVEALLVRLPHRPEALDALAAGTVGRLGEIPILVDADLAPGTFAIQEAGGRRHLFRVGDAGDDPLEPPPLAGGSLCPVHTGTPEPCPTCGAYIAAGL